MCLSKKIWLAAGGTVAGVAAIAATTFVMVNDTEAAQAPDYKVSDA